eukprot:1107959-Prorocentrum_minimum.AAC.3
MGDHERVATHSHLCVAEGFVGFVGFEGFEGFKGLAAWLGAAYLAIHFSRISRPSVSPPLNGNECSVSGYPSSAARPNTQAHAPSVRFHGEEVIQRQGARFGSGGGLITTVQVGMAVTVNRKGQSNSIGWFNNVITYKLQSIWYTRRHSRAVVSHHCVCKPLVSKRRCRSKQPPMEELLYLREGGGCYILLYLRTGGGGGAYPGLGQRAQ